MQRFALYGHGIEPSFQVMLQYINNVMFGGLFWHRVCCICHLTHRNSHRNNRFFHFGAFSTNCENSDYRRCMWNHFCWTCLCNMCFCSFKTKGRLRTMSCFRRIPGNLDKIFFESLRNCIHHLQRNPFRILSWDKEEVRRPCFCLLPREKGFISLQSNRAVCQYYLDECTYTIMIHVMQFIKI